MPRRSPALVLVHVVWATSGRRPILEPSSDALLSGILAGKAAELGCVLVCAGCAPDHVHTILRLAPTVPLADLVHRLKGGSSYEANRHPLIERPVYWQEGYWAESFGPADLTPLGLYVRSQRRHHDVSHPAERWAFSAT